MKVNPENPGYSPSSIIRKKELLTPEEKIEKRYPEKRIAEKPGDEIRMDNNISDDEKTFFAEMYPMSKKDIMDYHYYQRSGKPSGIVLGSLFDKRG
jgi:hypothetical protein